MPSGLVQDDGWCMFVSREEDVGTLEEWLETVEQCLNSSTISENKEIFKWKVTFACTSWGNQTTIRCLQDVILNSEVAQIVTAIHELTKPKNRINITELPLRDYFHTNEEGVDIVQQHLATILG